MMKTNAAEKSLSDFTASELKSLEASELNRTTLPEWRGDWLRLSKECDSASLNRRLAEEHRHGRLFEDAVEDYFCTDPRAKRGAGSSRAKWNVVKPLFAGVRVPDVDDRLLAVASECRSLTFVQDVLRFVRQQRRERNSNRVPLATEYRTAKQLREVWVDHVDRRICPDAFVTILMPHAALSEGKRTDAVPRHPEFYLRLMTKEAEHNLWGTTTRHIRRQENRCLWIGVHEMGFQDSTTGFRGKFLHYHFLLKLPTRPMVEEATNILPPADRLARVQDALLRASTLTQEAIRDRRSAG